MFAFIILFGVDDFLHFVVYSFHDLNIIHCNPWFCADAQCWWRVVLSAFLWTMVLAHHARSLNTDNDHKNNGKTTHPVTTYSLTNNTYPLSPTHRATIQGFCADAHRLTMKAILKLMLEHKKGNKLPTQ